MQVIGSGGTSDIREEETQGNKNGTSSPLFDADFIDKHDSMF